MNGTLGCMHGYTDVDHQKRPQECVDTLDTLAVEPFYERYQARVRELLRPRRGGRFLEVGAGTGRSAARLREECRVDVVTVDRS